MSTVERQITTRARKYSDEALTNLHKFIDQRLLEESFAGLNKRGAGGVDGQRWKDYNEEKEERIPQLLTAFKKGSYRAPHIRRTYIPKGKGKMRPLGLPTVEDKVLQGAVTQVLTPIYEEVFYNNSYGFRPGKSQHQALQGLFEEVSFKGMRYVIDADMKNYFGSISHQWLRKFLDLRIRDGVIRKQIDKWLKAGILEGKELTYPKEGTPQGGTISPLLSNIYLHYALDEWFIQQIQPLLKGKSSLIRYADDFLLLFSNKRDAQRVMEVLPKRLGKYDLTLHPEKTKLIELSDDTGRRGFDFLGFTHYMGRSRKGIKILKRKTSRKKFRSSLVKMNEWLSANRHEPIRELIGALNRKLRGIYNYYGITFNYARLHSYYEAIKRILFKWLNRRGGGKRWNWETYVTFIYKHFPLLRPRIYHSTL